MLPGSFEGIHHDCVGCGKGMFDKENAYATCDSNDEHEDMYICMV